ncbi:MAG: matrixin family metalloprotease [Lacipirellulaceae bacterium]
MKPARIAALATLVAWLTSFERVAAFSILDRWSITASYPVVERGDPITLTWSIAPDGAPTRGGAGSELVRTLDSAFGSMGAVGDFTERPWFPILASSFDRWGSLGGVRFAYEPRDDGAAVGSSPGVLNVRGDVRLAAVAVDGAGRTIATGQLPDEGDVVFDSGDRNLMADARLGFLPLRNVLMHEIGHTLGLGHVYSDDAFVLMEPELSLSFDGPQIDDVRGLHRLYGDRFERGGNDSFGAATGLGGIQPGETIVVGAAAGAASGPDAAIDFVSIDGLSDSDFFRIDVREAGSLSIEVVPRGGAFRQGLAPESQTPLDADSSNNLNLALFGSDPTAPLVVANGQRRGIVERVTDFAVPVGAYVLQVNGANDAAQLYEVRITLRSATIPEPAAAVVAIGLVGMVSASARVSRR